MSLLDEYTGLNQGMYKCLIPLKVPSLIKHIRSYTYSLHDSLIKDKHTATFNVRIDNSYLFIMSILQYMNF